MAPERDPRIAKAFKAMRSLGIDAETVKPVLRRLLKLYNRNWELIEEDNFRTLADAIFEHSDDKEKAEENRDSVDEDVEPPFKKPHRGLLKDQVLSTGGNGKSIKGTEDGEVPKSSNDIMMVESPQSISRDPTQCCVSEAPSGSKCKNPIRVNSALDEENSSKRPALGAPYSNREPNNPVLDRMIRDMALDRENINAIELRENQHVDRSPRFAAPTSRICPGSSNTSERSEKRKKKLESSTSDDHQTMFQTAYDIASSTCGQRAPATIFCETTGAQFSLIKLLNELCESYLETNRSSGNYIHRSLSCSKDSTRKDQPEGDQGKRISSGSGSSVSRGPVIAGHSDKKKVFHKVSDITNGTEKMKISLLDEKGNEDLPYYIYCPENITYESAYVHASLARISDEDCCSGCTGDCLSSSIPCTCARDTGGNLLILQKAC
ncbi:UNVERIFIED_CONTAM: Histone-lysine N-methyltransferase SUVR4 [Sesamum latifolium]|uniref:Histone-lysine N-methyltransferase SUVR4 n=1 Tax=Sesamum latifolium TaxID=2727402 RepID=A0AAW2TFK6_9LAMI